jgi:hypothetical protein
MRTHSERNADAKRTDCHSGRSADGMPIRSQTLEATERPNDSTSPQDAVSSTATQHVTGDTEAEVERWLTAAALAHHREAAEYHEREAQWNSRWAAWHRAEAARLGEGV